MEEWKEFDRLLQDVVNMEGSGMMYYCKQSKEEMVGKVEYALVIPVVRK